MHILDKEFREKLVNIYIDKTRGFNRPKDIFYSVITYLGEEESEDIIDEVRKLIDALADWTHNPTESKLREILDVQKTVYVLTEGKEIIGVFESIETLENYISDGTEIDFIEEREILQYVVHSKNGVTHTYDAWERYLE